ncbi:hypothetical protein [Luteibacter sp. dw_328]|uniref:hypothetical protein n=1 Tax=Luteibacter sp. dw_328 TaxID=2719796 RepID=UPI001BD237C2|nr:hypothetical protein [Luteibacter sp. dw_328]
MGEWSDYFEDFPEENQANYVNGRFDPAGAAAHRAAEAKRAAAQAELNATISGLIKDGKRREQENKDATRKAAKGKKA